MLDTWAIGSDDGWAYADGVDAQTVTPLFTTAGRLKSTNNVVQAADAGGRTVVTSRRELHIPVDSAAVPPGALAQCTAVHESSDPTLLNAVVRLDGPAPGSQTTARRLQVSEVLT